MFIEHAPAALAMLDREMRYLAVSRRWLEMHSLGDVEIIGHSHYEIFPRTPESWREEHRRCLAGEKMEASERELTRADGSVQWIRREILPWRAGDGSSGRNCDLLRGHHGAKTGRGAAAAGRHGLHRRPRRHHDYRSRGHDSGGERRLYAHYRLHAGRGAGAQSAHAAIGPAEQGILREHVGLPDSGWPLVG